MDWTLVVVFGISLIFIIPFTIFYWKNAKSEEESKKRFRAIVAKENISEVEKIQLIWEMGAQEYPPYTRVKVRK